PPWAPGRLVAVAPLALARQLAAGARADPEAQEPVVVSLPAELARDLRGADVRRLLDALGDRDEAVPFGDVGDRVLAELQLPALDVDELGRRDRARVERRDHREDLHHRARLEGVAARPLPAV